MKQVTMESVKQRIAVLESAGKIVGVLGLGGEFELACLRELVSVTEQRDAVVRELAELKNNFNLDVLEKPVWDEYLKYDKEDGIFIWKKRSEKHFQNKRAMSVWNAKYSGKLAGSVHTSKCGHMSIYITINNKKYNAHRVAWEMVNGAIPDGMSIDHIDHNPLNNSIVNLRLATEEEQKKNYPMNIKNKSGYVGVSLCKKTNKWRARISKDGKTIELGESENINEAIALRKAAEKELNFHENHGKGRCFSSQLRESKGAQS